MNPDDEILAEKYIGKETLCSGRSIPDLWMKRQWYMNRIFDLGTGAGVARQRMRRCKNIESPIWKRLEKVETECKQLADALMLEMLEGPK
jgi:hypothetical protein